MHFLPVLLRSYAAETLGLQSEYWFQLDQSDWCQNKVGGNVFYYTIFKPWPLSTAQRCELVDLIFKGRKSRQLQIKTWPLTLHSWYLCIIFLIVQCLFTKDEDECRQLGLLPVYNHDSAKACCQLKAANQSLLATCYCLTFVLDAVESREGREKPQISDIGTEWSVQPEISLKVCLAISRKEKRLQQTKSLLSLILAVVT